MFNYVIEYSGLNLNLTNIPHYYLSHYSNSTSAIELVR